MSSKQLEQAQLWIEMGKKFRVEAMGHPHMNKLSNDLKEAGFHWLRDLTRDKDPYIPALLYLAMAYKADDFKAYLALLVHGATTVGDPECCRLAIEAYTHGGTGVKPDKKKVAEINRARGMAELKKKMAGVA